MEPTPNKLLQSLPEYRDEWVLVADNQDVRDIIADMLDKHKEFAPYYDRIALFFNGEDTADICESLYRFCKKYLHYREEPDSQQTTAVPQGLLVRGFCDCKGYAGFIAGCLDGLRRLTGKKIGWAYRFASYNFLDPSPHHVFVVVSDPDEGEIWVDPTPRAREMVPFWQTDKTVKTMPLYSNIGAVNRRLGIASELVSLRTNAIPNLSFDTSGPWPYPASPWPSYLSLDKFRDYYGDRNINEAALATQINTAIASGPSPGHTIDPAFVKWVYDNSIRSWNFYYPGGVDPSFDYTKYVPASFSWVDSGGNKQTIVPPHWVVTKDNRVTFDHDVKLDDYRNYLIHILTAGAQGFINTLDASPFPLKPADLKNFSQAYTGNPNNPAASILKEWRGTSDVTKALTAATTFVTNTILKVVGAVPRNAFLALVGINLFRMATDLQNSINAGHWDSISSTWSKLGGDPQKLLNTISHGSGQPEVDDTTGTVTSGDQISGIGNPAIIAAVIAAAVPIITALGQWFTHSSVKAASGSYVDQLNATNPAGHYSLVNGQLYSNGAPVSMQGTPAVTATSFIVPALAAGLTYFLVNRGKQKKTFLLPAAVGVGTFFIMRKFETPPPVPTTGLPVTTTPSPTGVLTTILNDLKNILPGSSSTPTPSTPITAGDGGTLNPDLATAGQSVAGWWREEPLPIFND